MGIIGRHLLCHPHHHRLETRQLLLLLSHHLLLLSHLLLLLSKEGLGLLPLSPLVLQLLLCCVIVRSCMLQWKTWNEVWMTKEEKHTRKESMAKDDAVGRTSKVGEELLLLLARLIALIDGTVLRSTAPSHSHKRPFFLPCPASMATAGSKGSTSGSFSVPYFASNFARYLVFLTSAIVLTHFSFPALSFVLCFWFQILNNETGAPSCCACKR